MGKATVDFLVKSFKNYFHRGVIYHSLRTYIINTTANQRKTL